MRAGRRGDPGQVRVQESGESVEPGVIRGHCWAGLPTYAAGSGTSMRVWTLLPRTKVLPDPLPRVWVQDSLNRHKFNLGSNQSTSEPSDALSWAGYLVVPRAGAGLPQFPHLCPGGLFWLHLVFEVILRN